jgi:hypothetical protein
MRTAIIIKGNPKFIEGNVSAENFYNDLRTFLEGLGYIVSFDDGESYTTPPEADLWIGHSRGSDRLRFAPKSTKTIALGIQGGINHPKDRAILPGQIPDEFHYILNDEMKNQIKLALQ